MADDWFFSLNDVEENDFDLASEFEETLKLDVSLENVEESTVDLLLDAVRAQYVILEEENSRLLKLSSLIKEKIDDCEALDMTGKATTEPLTFALDLDIKPDIEDVEEEDDDDLEEQHIQYIG